MRGCDPTECTAWAVRKSTGRELKMSDAWKAVLTVIVLVASMVIESRCDGEY